MDRRDEDEPLKDEALKRDQWRGGETQLRPEDGGGHSLPASEDNDESLRDAATEPQGHPGTIPPPD